MKKIVYMFLVLLLVSCEDVIELDTPSEEPRLVVDAIIRVDTNQEFTDVIVKVSQTSSFFENSPPVTLDQITLTNLDNPPSGNESILFEQEPGIYSRFFPTNELVNDNFVLQINFEDEIFIAQSKFVPSTPINSITQGNETLFDEDDIEIIVNFTDNVGRTDFYLFDFDFNNFLTSEDTFYQDQEFEFSYYYEENLDPGDEVTISILGASERFFNYMSQIIEQSGSVDFGAFQTPALTVRGNIINATDIDNNDNYNNVNLSDNFALGYFAIVQEYKDSIIIE